MIVADAVQFITVQRGSIPDVRELAGTHGLETANLPVSAWRLAIFPKIMIVRVKVLKMPISSTLASGGWGLPLQLNQDYLFVKLYDGEKFR